jgi:hypothetical protein
MVDPSVSVWLRAFAWTLLLEVPLVLWLTRDSTMRVTRRGAIAIFANLATHPAVWFVFPKLCLDGGTLLVVQESWAVIVEWLVYFTVIPSLTLGRALGVSALANGVSFAIGLLLYSYTSLLG